MEDISKRETKAPCGYTAFDKEKNKSKTEYPAINCSSDCDRCGWNPQEKKRRFSEGEFRPISVRTNAETGEVIILPSNVKRLVFPKRA